MYNIRKTNEVWIVLNTCSDRTIQGHKSYMQATSMLLTHGWMFIATILVDAYSLMSLKIVCISELDITTI